jgi:hypothetical protein
MKMKTRKFVIILSVATLAALNVIAADAVLSPRAADNQTRKNAGFNNDPNFTATGPTAVTPRVVDNQIKTVAGKSDKVTPSTTFTRKKNGSPKSIGACADQPGSSMSCCSAPEVKPMK